MAITLFGIATTPADNGTSATNPTVVTPPSSMQAGDLVVFIGQRRANSGTLSISEAGGQTWVSLTQHSTTMCQTRIFWCIFNGTWSADPSITMGATLCNSAYMLVFRPDSGYAFVADVDLTSAAFSAPTTPFTLTITGMTIASGGVGIATWHCTAANTFGTLSGAGWSKTGLAAQYRNTAGSDQTASFAYYIGSGATGDVSQNESAGTAGATNTLSFKELANPQINVSDSIGVAESRTIEVQAAPGGDLSINVNDSVGVSETTYQFLNWLLSVTQNVGVTESTEQFLNWLISVSETIHVTESLGGFYSEAVFVSEAVQLSVSEAITDRTVNVSDGVGVAESQAAVLPDALAINVTQAVGVAETPAEVIGTLIDVTQSVGAAESTGQVISNSQINVTQAIGAGESTWQAVSASQINVSQNIGAVDGTPTISIGVAGELAVNVSDLVGVTETLTAALSAPQINVTQAVGVTENASASILAAGTLATSVSDAIAILESATVSVTPHPALVVNVSNSVSVVESRSFDLSMAVAATDNISLTDTAGLAVETSTISVTENIAISEWVVPYLQGTALAISVTDSIAVSSVNYSFINIGIFGELVFFAGTFASDLEFFNGTFTDDLDFCTAVTGDLEMVK